MNNADTTQKTQYPSNPFVDNAIRISLVALLAFLSFNIASPFIGPIFWGIIIAVATYPIYQWIQRKTGLGNGWTATLFTSLMLVFLVTPTVMLSSALVSETQELTAGLKSGSFTIPLPPEKVSDLPLFGKKLSTFWTELSNDPKATLGEFEPEVRKMVKWLISSAASATLGILLLIFSIIIAGVFLAKAQWGHRSIQMIFARLLGNDGTEMTNLSRHTITSVVNGILGIAVIQTLLAGMGFIAMDIPGAGILALICLVLAIVQIDILIILIPLSLYMFSVTGTGAAIAFLVWNILVGLMNNVLKPILLARGVEAPMAIIFIGAIGGLIAYGIIGLFAGAVVFVLSYALFVVWLKEDTQTV